MRWAGLLLVLALASCSRDEDYHDTAKPPAAYAGCKPTAAYVYSDQVDNLCASYLGRVARGRYRGCYVPATNTIILPVKPWPTLIRHEEAHACGWRHA